MKVQSNIGNAKVVVEGEVLTAKLDTVLEAGLKSMIYRAGAGKVFKKGKNGEAVKRDEPFGVKLETACKQALTEVFGPLLSGLAISVSELVKEESGTAKAVNEERRKAFETIKGLVGEAAALKAYPEFAPVAVVAESSQDEEEEGEFKEEAVNA